MIFNLVWLPARQTGSSTRTKVLLRIMLRDTTVCEDDLVKQALRETSTGFLKQPTPALNLANVISGKFQRLPNHCGNGVVDRDTDFRLKFADQMGCLQIGAEGGDGLGLGLGNLVHHAADFIFAD